MRLLIGLVAVSAMALVACDTAGGSGSSTQEIDSPSGDASFSDGGITELDGQAADVVEPTDSATPLADTSAPSDTGPSTDASPPNDASVDDTTVVEPPLGVVCPSEHFMDLSEVEGPGPAYDAPWLDVTCDEDTVTVQSNGLPHFTFQPMTPNALQTQNFNWVLPRVPEVAAVRTDIPLLGTAGIAINGCPIYGPNEGPFPDPYGDPIYNDIMDWNQGHTGGDGDYHFHALLTSTFYPNYVEGDVSPIIGYALDGFPVYGPYGCADTACSEIVKFESSWEVTGDPTTYAWDNYDCLAASCDQAAGEMLDRCNGRVGPDGTYRYHATDGFPYVLGCYSGTAGGAVGGGGIGGEPAGPTPCAQESDCDGECSADAMGCTCHTTPMNEQLCVPTCTTAQDCPMGPGGAPMNCVAQGVCVPAGGPPG